MSTYKQLSTLATLRTKLEGVSDWLVDAEFAFTNDGNISEFTFLHSRLGDMLEVVAGLEWEVSERQHSRPDSFTGEPSTDTLKRLGIKA